MPALHTRAPCRSLWRRCFPRAGLNWTRVPSKDHTRPDAVEDGRPCRFCSQPSLSGRRQRRARESGHRPCGPLRRSGAPRSAAPRAYSRRVNAPHRRMLACKPVGLSRALGVSGVERALGRAPPDASHRPHFRAEPVRSALHAFTAAWLNGADGRAGVRGDRSGRGAGTVSAPERNEAAAGNWARRRA